jgi:hypothetical protein
MEHLKESNLSCIEFPSLSHITSVSHRIISYTMFPDYILHSFVILRGYFGIGHILKELVNIFV